MEASRNRERKRTRDQGKGFQFEPFAPQGDGVLLEDAALVPDEELIVFERGGVERGLILRQMSYHHVAQGELAGEPYLVTF